MAKLLGQFRPRRRYRPWRRLVLGAMLAVLALFAIDRILSRPAPNTGGFGGRFMFDSARSMMAAVPTSHARPLPSHSDAADPGDAAPTPLKRPLADPATATAMAGAMTTSSFERQHSFGYANLRQGTVEDDIPWLEDARWRRSFSSGLAASQAHVLLPHLARRVPIYAYYDGNYTADSETHEAEQDLLMAWRRAWWAQGFRPVILTLDDAVNHPLYSDLTGSMGGIAPPPGAELARWLAWGAVGGGLLCRYTLLPMESRWHPELERLRRNEYSRLARWTGLDDALVAGSESAVSEALAELVDLPAGTLYMKMHHLATLPYWHEEADASAFAYYSDDALTRMYGRVAVRLSENRPSGVRSLGRLINAHLHMTWQNTFAEGIAVLQPHPRHTSRLVSSAMALVESLCRCSGSLMPTSCPPNRPKCTPCVATPNASPMRVTRPKSFVNLTGLYTIGTVPHPYTFVSLTSQRDTFDVSWIRLNTDRNVWTDSVTRALFGRKSGSSRIVLFKDVVAGEPDASSRSLWLLAEKEAPSLDELAWHFGFALPGAGTSDGDGWSKSPVPALRQSPQHFGWGGSKIAPEELRAQEDLLDKARWVVMEDHSPFVGEEGGGGEEALRSVVEAWNMEDTEAWRFASAVQKRRAAELRGLLGKAR